MPEIKETKYKAPLAQQVLQQFPDALELVAWVTEFGNYKHTRKNSWNEVPNAPQFYQDAAARHATSPWTHDRESAIIHAAHQVTSALMSLQSALNHGLVKPFGMPLEEVIAHWEDCSVGGKEWGTWE